MTAFATPPTGTTVVSADIRRVIACAAPHVSATAARAVRPRPLKPLTSPEISKGFAALKVIGAFGVHDDTVRAVDGNHRAVLPERPQRQAFKGSRVGGWICIDHLQIGDDGLGFARRHAKLEAASLRAAVSAAETQRFEPDFRNDDKRLVSWHGSLSMPTYPVCWQRVGK